MNLEELALFGDGLVEEYEDSNYKPSVLIQKVCVSYLNIMYYIYSQKVAFIYFISRILRVHIFHVNKL